MSTETTGVAPFGRTRFSLRAMEKVISSAIASVPGTAAVDAKLAGLAGRAFPRVMAQMDPDTQMVAVDVDIAVYWPSPVTEVAKAVRTAVREAVRDFTGFRTTRVNVTVGGAVPGERTTALAVETRTPLSAQIPAIVPERALKPVEVSQRAAVRQVSTPAPVPVRAVKVPEAVRVRGVGKPADVKVRTEGFGPGENHCDKLRPIHTAEPQPLRAVAEPAPVQVRSVSAPREFALRHVETPRPVEPRGVGVPHAMALRVPHAKPLQLRPIAIRPSAEFTRRVDVPRPTPLRAITIREGGHHE